MAFPVDEAVQYTQFNTTADVPANPQAGERLLAIVCTRFEDSVPAPSGWPEAHTAANVNRLSIFSKISDGTETTITVSGTAPLTRIYRISGVDTSAPIEVTFATGTSATPDPPSEASSGGSADNLWFAPIEAHDDQSVNAYPLPDNQVGIIFGTVGQAVCTTDSATASLDPGAYTLSASGDWIAATIVIRPAGSAGTDGSAAGSYGYQGTAAGQATALGSADGSYGYSGTAQGQTTVVGSAAGSYGYAGTASGQATAVGSAAGSYAYAGTAQGQAAVVGSAAGPYGYVGTANGDVADTGSASGSYGYGGTASGQAVVIGSASGSYSYVGTAIGTGEATGVEPTILPPYREPKLPAYREGPTALYRETSIPAFREPPP